jgi:hypothetical protein
MEICFKVGITEMKCTLYVRLQESAVPATRMMQLTSQASPNIVPAAVLPVALPRLKLGVHMALIVSDVSSFHLSIVNAAFSVIEPSPLSTDIKTSFLVHYCSC